MSRKIFVLSFFILIAMVFTTSQVMAADRSIPGWGVQAYVNGEPWENMTAEAFHYSPDGSFYEVSDEEFQLKIGVTVNVTADVMRHQIPVDASCGVSLFLDGVYVTNAVNAHTYLSVDLTQGTHTLEIINQCGGTSDNWMGMVIGKCLWGTNRNISFVKASAQ